MILDVAGIADLTESLLARATQLESDGKKMQEEANAILDMLEIQTPAKPRPVAKPEPVPDLQPTVAATQPVKPPRIYLPPDPGGYAEEEPGLKCPLDSTFVLGQQPVMTFSDADPGANWRSVFAQDHCLVFASDSNIPRGPGVGKLVLSYIMNEQSVGVAYNIDATRSVVTRFRTFDQVIAECENRTGLTFSQATKSTLWYSIERMIAFCEEEDPFGLDSSIRAAEVGGLNIISRRHAYQVVVDPCLSPMPGTPSVSLSACFNKVHSSLIRIEGGPRMRFPDLVDHIALTFGGPISRHSAESLRVVLRATLMPKRRGYSGNVPV